MAKKKKKSLTSEDLARMIQRGFEDAATKTEITDLRQEMNERFDRMELHFSASSIRVREDINYLDTYIKHLERQNAHRECFAINLMLIKAYHACLSCLGRTKKTSPSSSTGLHSPSKSAWTAHCEYSTFTRVGVHVMWKKNPSSTGCCDQLLELGAGGVLVA